eukprot:6492296-Amphidinium_carterae.2
MSVVPRQPYRGRESAREWRPDWGKGELLPLPRPGVEEAPKVGLSRGCQQRIQRRRHEQKLLSDAVAGLNWLAGFDTDAADGPAIPLQSHALANLADRVK